MVKNHYLRELSIPVTQRRGGASNSKKETKKIQCWLSLYGIQNPTAGTSTGIDGDFGPATEQAVKNFQRANGLTQNGIVTQQLFDMLSNPMRLAFETPLQTTGIRNMVVEAALLHLASAPLELDYDKQSNMGPWVRSYMNSQEGNEWYWCMGFVQTIIDQAASQLQKDFRKWMPLTFSCDTLGTHGLQKGWLTRFTSVRNNPSQVKPGDIFLLQKTPHDWTHTGIITAIGNDTFETIEGNTNEGGSRNGNGVFKRIRNFRTSKLDVFSIESMV